MADNILLMGLPDTGRTTFIAALWAYLNENTTDKMLTPYFQEDAEHEYLNDITRTYLDCNNQERNKSFDIKEIRINLMVTDTEKIINLDLPDISGEIFTSHFEDRAWNPVYGQKITNATGLLLFVTPNTNNNIPILINEANRLTDIVNGKPSTVRGSGTTRPYQPSFASNQVKLTEELQFIAWHVPHILPIKIAIIVSAWDQIETGSVMIPPKDWVKAHLPLLYQYLICNQDIFKADFFGVSPQGCNYKEERMARKFYGKEPGKRIKVRHGELLSNDITKPIIWVLQ